jgi:hypothetical protein
MNRSNDAAITLCLKHRKILIMSANTTTNSKSSAFLSGLKTAASVAASIGVQVAIVAGGVAIGTVAAAKYLAPKE